MRILFAHSFYRISGGEDRHVREQVDLVARTHDVHLVSQANIHLSPGATTAARMLYSRAQEHDIGTIIDRFAPDVVHVHNAYPSFGPAVVLAASARAVPIVMTIHNHRLRCPNGLVFTEGTVCHRCESGLYVNAVLHRCFPTRRQAGAYAAALWVHRFVMRLEERVQRFIVPSEFMRRRVLEWGIREERVRLVRHFVRSAVRTAGDPSAGSYGIFVGRLSGEKGVDLLLRALHRAGDPPFLIVGDGPLKAELEGLADELGLVRTRFLGARPHGEVGELMAHARYLALLSAGEEVSALVAIEALAAGRPLLVSERGGLPELVTEGEGLICRAEDVADTSEKLLQLIGDDDLHRRASIRAARTGELFTPERHLEGLEAVYREVSGAERIDGTAT